ASAVCPPAEQPSNRPLPRDPRKGVAGAPADGAERRGPRAGRAGPPLVIVAMAHDADAVALREGVVQQPFERSPGRVDFDATFEAPVMGALEVRITSADMGDDQSVLALKCSEQIVCRGAFCLRLA